MSRGGVRVWPKEIGLGPIAVGLHGFKPHPPHHYVDFRGGVHRARVCAEDSDTLLSAIECLRTVLDARISS